MTMQTTELRDILYDRVARMMARRIPQKQIAVALNLSEERISAICQVEDVKSRAAAIASETEERFETLDKGWDTVEELGLTSVLHALQNTYDPEFALKAIAMANKASRRRPDLQPTLASQHGVRRVIQLSGVFVRELQATVREPRAINQEPKAQDVLDTTEVETLLEVQQRGTVGERVMTALNLAIAD